MSTEQIEHKDNIFPWLTAIYRPPATTKDINHRNPAAESYKKNLSSIIRKENHFFYLFPRYDKTDTITRKYKKRKEKQKDQRKEENKKKKKRNGVVNNGGWEKKESAERNHGGHCESKNPSEFREEADHRNVAEDIS